MNWARGFFRLWLVLSVLWIGAVAWAERDRLCWTSSGGRHVEAAATNGPLFLARLDETLVEEAWRSLIDCAPPRVGVSSWWRTHEPVLVVMLGPPVAAFVFGCVLLWVGRGFRLSR